MGLLPHLCPPLIFGFFLVLTASAQIPAPADLASLLTWLRSNLRADTRERTVLFDEEPGFAALLNTESGTATIKSAGAAFGKLCLRISPPQRAAKQLPGWNYRIVEKPAAPREWDTVTLDLWRDMGAFTLTGLAPTAMGGDAWFDRIELLR